MTTANNLTKPRVALFLGAGASAPFGYPTVMQFFNKMDKLDIWNQIKQYGALKATTEGFSNIIHNFYGYKHPYSFPDFNAEALLGELELLSRQLSLIGESSYKIPLPLGRTGFHTPSDLLRYLKIGLVKVYSDESGEGDPYPKYQELLSSLNKWGYLYPPLDIFTTNYDRILDITIPHAIQTISSSNSAWKDAEIGDGFVGQPRSWDGDIAIEDRKIRLYKLHGSVTWKRKNGQIFDILFSDPNPDSDHLLWFGYKRIPDDVPFRLLHDYLRLALSDNVIFLVIGFQFGDPYIRDLFDSALILNEKLKVVCCLKDMPSSGTIIDMQNNFPNFSLIQAEFGSVDFISKIQQYFP